MKIVDLFLPVARLYWFIFRPETYGVKVVIYSGDEILFIKNNYGTRSWTFPGGGIKRGEMPENAARREVKEEVGINLDKVNFVSRILSEKEYKKDNIFVYRANTENMNFKIDDLEIQEAKWFSKNNLPEMSPVAEEILTLLNQ